MVTLEYSTCRLMFSDQYVLTEYTGEGQNDEVYGVTTREGHLLATSIRIRCAIVHY